MIVMKFGGTSVGSAEAIRRAADIVTQSRTRDPVVVVSAVSGITDALLAAARSAQRRDQTAEALLHPIRARHRDILSELELAPTMLDRDFEQLEEALHGVYLLRELTSRSFDYLVSFGELLSSQIVAAHLAARGTPARAWAAWDAGMLTDGQHGEAKPLPESYDRIRERLGPELGKRIPVVTGFLGQTETGERTTLGRGGSDYSAALFGRALDAEEVQIWTDVSGILSCDPRVVPGAFTLRYLTFAEASELAYFGAKVLHPKTIEPACEVEIPVRVKSTFAPDDPGTLVVKSSQESEERAIEGLAVKRGNVLVNLVSTRMLDAEGYLARLFGTLARHHVSVDCLATSEVSVSLTTEQRYLPALERALEEMADEARATILTGRSIVCVVGEGMKRAPGIAGRIFGVVGREGINVELISQGASELNLTFVVPDEHADRILVELHAEFLEGRQRSVVPG
jgi:aspartate kinase